MTCYVILTNFTGERQDQNNSTVYNLSWYYEIALKIQTNIYDFKLPEHKIVVTRILREFLYVLHDSRYKPRHGLNHDKHKHFLSWLSPCRDTTVKVKSRPQRILVWSRSYITKSAEGVQNAYGWLRGGGGGGLPVDYVIKFFG